MKIRSHSNLFDEVGQCITQVNEIGRRNNQTRVTIEGVRKTCRGSRQKLDKSADRKLSVKILKINVRKGPLSTRLLQ